MNKQIIVPDGYMPNGWRFATVLLVIFVAVAVAHRAARTLHNGRKPTRREVER